MYLNISKRIKNTVDTRDNRHLNMVVSKIRVLYTPGIDLVGGTPEYKLKSGFCARYTIPFRVWQGVF